MFNTVILFLSYKYWLSICYELSILTLSPPIGWGAGYCSSVRLVDGEGIKPETDETNIGVASTNRESAGRGITGGALEISIVHRSCSPTPSTKGAAHSEPPGTLASGDPSSL